MSRTFSPRVEESLKTHSAELKHQPTLPPQPLCVNSYDMKLMVKTQEISNAK